MALGDNTKGLFSGLGGFSSIFRLPTRIVDDPNRDLKNEIVNQSSITIDNSEDGSYLLDTTHYIVSTAISETVSRNQAQLINEYRAMALHSDVDNAIDDIVNGMVSSEVEEDVVVLDLSSIPDTQLSTAIKNKIMAEDTYIRETLLDFNNTAYEKVRSWYIDGRQCFQTVIDESNPKGGIIKVIPLDSRAIQPVRQVKREADPNTRIEHIVAERKFYIYNPNLIRDLDTTASTTSNNYSITSYNASSSKQVLEIDENSIVMSHCGIMNPDKTLILSHLEKARKPLNNLRTLEDAVVIYRITRASERRLWYIDVGTLPVKAAEEYMDHIIKRQKTKMQYDPVSGQVNGNTMQMSIMEDIFIPRREGSSSSEIDTLPGATNLDALDDLLYFQKKLFRSLNVPMSRMEGETSGFLLGGRGAEISRDEWKFSCFINRLRRRYSTIFKDLLKKQLILKNIITSEDWDMFIAPKIKYIYTADGYLKDAQDEEAFQTKLANLQIIDQFVGKYFSQKTVFKKVLQMSDEEISEEMEQMFGEIQAGLIVDPFLMQQEELNNMRAETKSKMSSGTK